MAQFTHVRQLNGAENPIMFTLPIANSATVAVGEAVKLQAFSSGGGVLRATAGSTVVGIVVGIVNNSNLDLDNAAADTYDGTWTGSTKTYVATSDNMTDKVVSAQVIFDPNAVFENDSAGDLAIADLFKFFDLTSATQIANQNGHDTAGAFQLLEIDPEDASVGQFKIAESALLPYAQQ